MDNEKTYKIETITGVVGVQRGFDVQESQGHPHRKRKIFLSYNLNGSLGLPEKKEFMPGRRVRRPSLVYEWYYRDPVMSP